MTTTALCTNLTDTGCRRRQDRLRGHLAERSLDAALITRPEHVFYLTNHWCRPLFAPALVVAADGPATLAAPVDPGPGVYADQVHTYPANRLCTLTDDQPAAALQPLGPALAGCRRLGCDDALRPWALAPAELVDLNPALYAMRRAKDPDEVALIRTAIAGCLAAYDVARALLAPAQTQATEVQIHARMHAAAVEAVGEPIGEFGNDFQSGAAGGPPRRRRVEPGELMPLDIGVTVKGHHSDLCRTFAVGGAATAAQIEAARLAVEVLDHAERTVRPGSSCRELYEQAFAMLDGRNGWRFDHHLGHGVGLSAHEAPRLNPHWDDVFAVGDVFTVEPGLYGDELKAGVRIENDYLVTPDGVERLNDYPTAL